MEAGPPGQIEVRVLGVQVDWQDIDGDPATVPAINIEQAVRIGWEPGPDTYRFVFVAPQVAVCPPSPPPGYGPGPVASTFDAGAEGWTLIGDANPVPEHADGAIAATDLEGGATWYFQAPPSFLGDRRSLYGAELVYTLRTDGTGRMFPAPGSPRRWRSDTDFGRGGPHMGVDPLPAPAGHNCALGCRGN